ncbi:pentapeptide repeat-containing protein [Streptomyces endophyticus]|uniref:Pentapeptide repeat-containing protein n=1 Tax=Streptomyces endophyticus TaxID=714166 RepID=A0ABU6FHL3_9ACTN|nr:pentapeptide repeat-containing protein [Streptomyces endophyticus]MEB8343413.1 pentapeptide repeat-containing protein [Streptomyces endophyticus]
MSDEQTAPTKRPWWFWPTAAAGTAAYIVLLIWGPWWIEGHHLRDKNGDLVTSAGIIITGFRTMLVAIAAGGLTAAGLYYTRRKHQLEREQLQHTQQQFAESQQQFETTLRETQKRDAEQAELTREGQVSDRYVEAIKLLGSVNLAERLGGIYSLKRILHDSAKDHDTVVEVLAAYVRQHAPSAAVEPGDNPSGRPTTDVQAALTAIALRPNRDENPTIDLSGVDLSGAVLKEAVLDLVDFRKARLTRADLEDAVMQEAVLDGAHLEHANLYGAVLCGARLADAKVDCANLMHADLGYVVATRASFRGASLNLAKLGEADFGAVDLRGASFQETDVKMTNLGGADLAGVYAMAKGQFYEAFLDDETKFDPAIAEDPEIVARIEECRDMF